MYNASSAEYEFTNSRSEKYKEAVEYVGDIWNEDIEIMYEFLFPEPGDKILEVGAGSGFFSFPIANAIGDQGLLYVTDPSIEQLQSVLLHKKENMIVLVQRAEDIYLGDDAPLINKIWSRGAFHHVNDKTKTFARWRKLVHPDSKLVIFDIFSHNKTAFFLMLLLHRLVSLAMKFRI